MLHHRILVYFPCYLFLHVLFFIFLKIYVGIIRHSSYIDAVKIFTALLFVLLSGVTYNIIHFYLSGEKVFMNSGLFIMDMQIKLSRKLFASFS